MPWPEDALSDGESIVTAFRPHWKLLFIPALWFIGLSIGALVAAVNFNWFFGALLIVLAGLFLLFVVKPFVTWWTTRYVLTSERLITRTGLIAKSGIEIPLERITNVNFSQTVFERMLGAGDLLVESAGTTGQSAFANIPHPDRFQTVLYKVREQRTIELSGTGHRSTEEDDPAETIRKLAQLHADGLISDDEHETKRREALDEM